MSVKPGACIPDRPPWFLLTALCSHIVACICSWGGHGLHRGEWHCEPCAVTRVRGVEPLSSFTPFTHRNVAFSLSSFGS